MMAWIRLVIVAVTISFFSSAHAEVRKIKESTLPNGLKVHEYRLQNGMEIFLVPDASSPAFSFQVWFKVGSVQEKLDPKLKRTGLAHLFEHMMFRGTKKYPNQQFDAVLTRAGVDGMNATTWLDRTNYFESLPSEHLELAFEIESDRMTNLIIEEKLFKTELGAVFGELKMRNDQPSSVAFEALLDLAYQAHPYRSSVIGTPDELNSFTVEEARHFYQTYYAPNNAAIIIVGGFKIDAALALAEKYYGPISFKELPTITVPSEPEQTKARERRITHPLTSSQRLMYGYVTQSARHADMAALQILAAVLGLGKSSLLEKELVAKGLTSSAGAEASSDMASSGMFYLEAVLAPGASVETVQNVVAKEIEKVQAGRLSEADLKRAKNQLLLSAYSPLIKNDKLGNYLGDGWISTGNALRQFDIIEQTRKVTVTDVQRVATRYLNKSRMNLVIVSPEKK